MTCSARFFSSCWSARAAAASSVVSRPRGMVPFMGRVVILLRRRGQLRCGRRVRGLGRGFGLRAEVEVGGVGYGLVLRERGEERGGREGRGEGDGVGEVDLVGVAGGDVGFDFFDGGEVVGGGDAEGWGWREGLRGWRRVGRVVAGVG